MSAATVAPVRRPPHDPLSLLLDGRVGWSVTAAVGAQVTDGALRISRDPASLSPLTAGSGTFGGLRPPATVAVGRDGTVWLLDPAAEKLLRFDPCTCAFAPVRSLAGVAVAVANDRLFVTDPTAGWLQALALPSTALSGRWRAPMPWRPTGVVVDTHHQILVADPQNGFLHTFGWTGRHLGHTAGIGASTALAVDAAGTVYAAGPAAAYRIQDGAVTEVTAPAEELASAFPASPVATDAAGNLLLGRLCAPPTTAAFDPGGRTVTPVPPVAVAPYLARGTVVIGPLDSRLSGCTWDRVVLHGTVPADGTVTVSTFTAHEALPAEDVAALGEPSWRTRLTTPAGAGDGWDALVLSDPGRYLWIRLQLDGSGRATPSITGLEVAYPRISLSRYLPAVYGAEPESAAFTDRFLALFDRSLRDVEAKIDGLPAVLDAEATPYLDWLAAWVGFALDQRLPVATRRRLLAASARLYDLRGTLTGLRELLLIVLGLGERPDPPRFACGGHEPGTCRPARATCAPEADEPARWTAPALVLEHFRLRRWLRLGRSSLGDAATVWGRRIANRSQLGEGAQVGGTQLKTSQDPLRDPFHVYAHRYTVFVPAAAGATPQQRRILQRLMAFGAPAHTVGSIEYVEPRFRIGIQSSLGLDAVVARVPTGLVLNQTPLGGTVLTGEPGARGAPTRLGTTSVLS